LLNQGRHLWSITMLIIVLTGAGLFLTYQAMVQTTGWPVPPLASWENRGSTWELEAVGLRATVNKEIIQPTQMIARFRSLGEGLTEWSQPILTQGLEIIRDAQMKVFRRLSGE